MTEKATAERAALQGPLSTGSRATRVLGLASIASLALLVFYTFKATKPDVELGETVRILYIHVPTISTAYLLLLTNAVASVVFLVKKNRFADHLAGASAEVGLLLLGLTLVTGMLWGRPTWGTYWVWDPRLTTTLIMFLMYLGYVTLRGLPGEFVTRGTRAAIVGIVSVFMLYPVRQSVNWWSSLHQGSTALGRPLKAEISGNQELALYIGFLAFLILAVWLVVHRFRLAWLEESARETSLTAEIAERRAAEAPGSTTDRADVSAAARVSQGAGSPQEDTQ